jgi:hypothetical protein
LRDMRTALPFLDVISTAMRSSLTKWFH